MFQLGRLSEPHNDFSIKGPLHSDQFGQQCGPVSRLACRIVCERLPPYRSFLYAGGFTTDKVKENQYFQFVFEGLLCIISSFRK
jgi:hypothetical protein